MKMIEKTLSSKATLVDNVIHPIPSPYLALLQNKRIRERFYDSIWLLRGLFEIRACGGQMKRVIISLAFIFAFPFSTFPQKQVRKELRKGNKEYKQEKYTEAEIDYRKGLELNARSADVAYNLGNSLYKQEKLPEAMEQYQAAVSDEKDKEKAAMAWHNAGNVFMKNKDYQKSIEAYKQALRRTPYDDETRYNLALAQKLLQDQENQDQNQDQQQDQKQDQQQEQNQDQQQDQNQDQQQQNPNQMQQQNAEQILEAMMQNERDTQEKVKEQQMQQIKQRKTGKNW
jgi:tetratricopeptide (TPR) repeat protein